MTNKNKINRFKVAVAGTVALAGAVVAVKLAKKENRDKVKKLISKYTKSGVEVGRKAVDIADKVSDIKKVIKEEFRGFKKQVKKV